jgi:hypothetical protein
MGRERRGRASREESEARLILVRFMCGNIASGAWHATSSFAGCVLSVLSRSTTIFYFFQCFRPTGSLTLAALDPQYDLLGAMTSEG